MTYIRKNHARTGSVYLAVLGTSLIVSVLALSALALQRVQNRMLTAAADTQQAQLNAQTALELGLLTIKSDTTWRTTYSNGNWFTNRGTGIGTCSLSVTDPADANLADDPLEPVLLVGIGYSGRAEQRVQLTLDFQAKPLACLRSAVAAGDSVALTSCVLRASTSGLISANSISATATATVYGTVEATSISGTTYSGTATQISASKRPAMPDWSSVFNYYRTNGTQINFSDLPTATANNFGRNPGLEIGAAYWDGTPPLTLLGGCQISQSNNWKRSGSYSLRVQNRDAWYSGPSQRIDQFVIAGGSYYIEAWVFSASTRNFYITLYTKGTGSSASFVPGSPSPITVAANVPTKVSATLTAPSWSGNLEYAFVKIAGADSTSILDFYVDDFLVRENLTGSLIYQKALGPGVNPFGTANAQGIYWINCNNNKIVIDRSHIRGTLLLVNPGVGSCVGPGPVRWSPAVAGYPALLVDADVASNADLTIMATNNTLSENANGANFNPTGCPSDDFGQDSDTNETCASQIQGLIAVEDDLIFQSPGNSVVRGQILVGDDISASSGTLEVAYQPDSLLNPPPGFTSTYQMVRRPASGKKVVLP